MQYEFNNKGAFNQLLSELEESILIWQRKQRTGENGKFFNAKKYLAKILDYKDINIIYRFLDPNDTSLVKFGIEDVETICVTIKDFKPLENYVNNLKAENKK